MTRRKSPSIVEPEAFRIIESAFIRTAKKMRIDVAELAAQFNNDPYQMARALEGMNWREDLLPGWAEGTNRAYKSQFNVEAKEIAVKQLLGQQDPLARAYVQTHGAERVRQVDENSRRAIRKLLDHGLEEGIPPVVLAQKLQSHIGLLPRQVLAIERREQALRKNGWRGRRLRRELTRHIKRLKRQRAALIGHTETLDAINQATLDVWNMGVQEGTIPSTAKKVWITAPDEKRCPTCGFLHGQKVELNDYFVGPNEDRYQRPTAHPGCRCTQGLIY